MAKLDVCVALDELLLSHEKREALVTSVKRLANDATALKSKQDIYDNNTLSAWTTAGSAYTSVIEEYYHNTVDDNYLSLEDNTYEKYVNRITVLCSRKQIYHIW